MAAGNAAVGDVMTVEFTFRPLPVWPYPPTPSRRWKPYRSSWLQTQRDLRRELGHLNATGVIVAAGWREKDMRLDGLPRANAPDPQHPGVEVSFDTRQHGRLVYPCDSCHHWEDNVRSIALGLEALRAVDRYGVTTSGQQYAGWRQIEATSSVPQATLERGRLLIAEHGGVRAAQRATHPDMGGDAIDFQSVTMAAGA